MVEFQGFSHYEIDERLYMSWQLDVETARLYFASDDFVEPSGGTEGDEYFTYTRLD